MPNHIILAFLTSGLADILLSDQPYLDPGSGSFILQLLLASLVGAAFLIKTYWRKITGVFRKSEKEEPEDKEE